MNNVRVWLFEEERFSDESSTQQVYATLEMALSDLDTSKYDQLVEVQKYEFRNGIDCMRFECSHNRDRVLITSFDVIEEGDDE